MESLQLNMICTYKMMTEDGEDEVGLKQNAISVTVITSI